MSIEKIKFSIKKSSQYSLLFSKISHGSSVPVRGIPGSLKSLFLSFIVEELKRPLLVVLPEHEEAESAAEELASLLTEQNVAFFPGGEEGTESPLIFNTRRAGSQMRAVRELLENKLKVIFVAPDGLAHPFPSPDEVKNRWLKLFPGIHQNLYELVEKLIDFGYTRESVVERPGEISQRGGILDVFPYTGEEPQRIEFFGDRVESIRIFDVATQLSIRKGESLLLMPSPSAWKDRSCSIFSYFPSELLLFLEDPELVLARVEKERLKGVRNLVDVETLRTAISNHQTVSFHTFSFPDEILDFGGRTLRKLGRTVTEIRENLSSLCDTHQKIFLLCERQDQVDRIKEFLELDEEPIPRIEIDVASIHQGFDLPSADIAVCTEGDIFGRIRRRKRGQRFHSGVPIRELSALKRGDFVVHIDHGIGKYQGLEKISVRDAERECLTLLYQGGDKLYVPVERMDRVQKYSGREGVQPTLNRLGTNQWEKTKARTKRSIKNIARELIDLYSARRALPGFAFSPDTPWQKELEATFLYEETPDQARAVEEVKRDMEQFRPMDRLVCGDVGYGKTEVAVRAAFKAVTEGKQVAMLVPTTILAEQHFRTFQDRLSRFPVIIEVLSRFRSRKEQKEIVEKLKRGEVDIVIGTHRLLSKDVGFKDIGLLIIDEEQRFGVRQKERLKTLRKTVDVLALSATPIPRTLHLSLVGIRDMSLINTPPKDRFPIMTEVVPFDKEIIAEAIEQEMARGGQVFFVHNRIQSIYGVARMVRQLVPGIRLAVAHGRMESSNLEKVMMDFIEGEYDCLVSTMIIESGLDLPNVNTLIVNRADRLGLAQLYQLRGRVGRSDKHARAYLLTPPFHLLTEEAVKRLRTIEEFTELGSGFQIALRDLEIRGAGNLLGVQQSGIMDVVGFDLYTKLIEEAVNELKKEGEKVKEEVSPPVECRVDFDQTAYLPESYVDDENLRVNLYRRLSVVQSFPEIDNFYNELRDRFGSVPPEVQNLLNITRLRLLGQEKKLKRIVLRDSVLQIFFDETWIQTFPTPGHISEYLRSAVQSSPVPVRFIQGKEFGFRVLIPQEEPFSFTKKLLQSWI